MPCAGDRHGFFYAQLDAGHELRLQDRKNRIGAERIENAACSVEAERLRFSHVEKTRDVIHVAICQRHRLDRARAQTVIRRGSKLGRGGDLLAQIGRGVEQQPVGAIDAHRQ